MEDEVDVDALLQQIASAKRKELHFQAEKTRVRRELEQLQAGALWTREEETQKQLVEVRRAKELLDGQRKLGEEKLTKLNRSLKEQELSFRKSVRPKGNPFQQVAVSVVTPAQTEAPLVKGSLEHQQEGENPAALPKKDGRTPTPDRYSDNIRLSTVNQESGDRGSDALQRLVGSLDCDEQQKRIERLQVELQQANARHREAGLELPPMKGTKRSAHRSSVDCPRAVEHPNDNDDLAADSMSNENTLLPKVVGTGGSTNTKQGTAVRKAVNKMLRLESLTEPERGSETLLSHNSQLSQSGGGSEPPPMANVTITGAPTSMSPPPYALPGYPQNYPPPTLPYPVFPPQFALPGLFNPYGVGFPPPYTPGYPLSAAPLSTWLPQGGLYSPPIGFAANGPVNPADQPPKHSLQLQEEEVRKLERELDMQRIANDQKAEAKEFSRLQDRLKELQSKVSSLAAAEDMTPVDSNDAAFAINGDDALALKSLKRQHLESLAKVRNERDLLEEQEKLEDLKESIQRRREEKKRTLDHEDWIAEQKRELVALRLQRTFQHDSGGLAALSGAASELQGESSQVYDPEGGFMLLWDYAAGVPTATNGLQITYAVFEGKLIRTPLKVASAKEMESVGPQHKRCMFLSGRHVKKLPPSVDLRVVIEVSAVSQLGLGASNQPLPKSLGWTAFNLFKPTSDGGLGLVTGSFKLPVKQSPMPDPSKTLILPPTTDCSELRIYIRVVHGELAGEASRMSIDPDSQAARYQAPETGIPLPRPQSNNIPSRRPSPQVKEATTVDPAVPSKLPDGQKLLSPSGTAEVRSERRPSIPPPQKPDFLDIERLRLLSSASSRPPSTRPRSNLPVPGSEKSRLPPFREDSDAEKDTAWIHVDKSAEIQRRIMSGSVFQPGDGFNLYLDGGRGFPDNVSISKVTVAALHADRTQVITVNGSSFASTTSDAFDPVFGMYVEYRQSSFNPTLTLVIRVDTIEFSSKQPVVLGYAAFPVFLDVETRDQPARPSIPQFVLSEGGFQLPLHTQIESADAKQQLSARSCEEFPRLPCATVLLRIARAKMAGDGLSLLSRKDFPPSEWETKGLLEPALQYYDRAYDSLRCIPTALEEKIYAIRQKNRRPKTIAQCLQQLLQDGSDARELLKVRDVCVRAKPLNYLDLSSALRYQPAIGFRVAIDALHNVKTKGGGFFKVLFSVYPPGSFYQPIRLTGDVYFTTTTDWTSAQSSPEFSDGFMTLRNSPSDHSLVVLFDVRSVTRHPKTGAITSQSFGWTFLPILSDTRSVATCSLQLPLFQGEVKLDALTATGGGLSALIGDIAGDKLKQTLPFVDDGASLFVRLQDPQLPSLSVQPITNASASKMIPPRASARYAYDSSKITALKKKAPVGRLLPANTSERQLEKELNQAFAQEMGIHHLLF